VAKAYTELADCGIIDTGAGRAARVKRVKPIPEPLVRAAKTYADEARRLGASLDDAFNALCAQCEAYTGCTVSEKSPMVLTVEGEARLQTSRKQYVAYSGR
jgi:hypothetical protein